MAKAPRSDVTLAQAVRWPFVTYLSTSSAAITELVTLKPDGGSAKAADVQSCRDYFRQDALLAMDFATTDAYDSFACTDPPLGLIKANQKGVGYFDANNSD
jgi:hypothetical protein